MPDFRGFPRFFKNLLFLQMRDHIGGGGPRNIVVDFHYNLEKGVLETVLFCFMERNPHLYPTPNIFCFRY